MGTPARQQQSQLSTSVKDKAAKAAAANSTARWRRQFFRRWTGAIRSKWAWLAVAAVALYVGLFYRSRVPAYTFEIKKGPGLDPSFASPTRYFRLAVHNSAGQKEVPPDFVTGQILLNWSIIPPIPGRFGSPVESEVHDLGHGDYVVTYRVREGVPRGYALRFRASYADRSASFSVETAEISIPGPIHEPSCAAPVSSSDWAKAMGCPRDIPQVAEDFKNFPTIDLVKLRSAVPKLLSKSSATSLLHYVIKDNQLYRKAYGPFPAFSYFADLMFNQLAATVRLPDVEFVLNVGDWPLVEKKWGESRVPVFSWCGSTDSFDIVFPQWDVTRSTVLGNTESNPDLIASQGWGLLPWASRDSRAAFRGRDSSAVRVKLAQLSAQHPDLLDVVITSWENDENIEVEEQLGGGKKHFLKLGEFSKYKYILQLDGTVAAYRNPYLLASGSLLLKQESPYYEWYQKELKPWQHYVPFDGTGEDLLVKLQWAREHDSEAQGIAANAREYARSHMLPERVLCYYFRALEAYAARQNGVPKVAEDMMWVPLAHQPKYNTCNSPDPQSQLEDYPILPLQPDSVETVLHNARKDAVVIVHSSFCNKSVRVFPTLVLMARKYKAAGANLMFASAEVFSKRFPLKWLQTTNEPKLFFLKSGSGVPQQLEGHLSMSTATDFINSKIPVQHRIEALQESQQTVSDPIPAKNDGPVKQVVADNFEQLVLNSNKDVLLMVSAPWCGYCKAIKPAYFRFARSVAADPAAAAVLDVAKMNGPTNEIQHEGFDIKGYPTIWFIRKNEKKPMIFSGSKTDEGFAAFVKQYATTPAELSGLRILKNEKHESVKTSGRSVSDKLNIPVLQIDADSFHTEVLASNKVLPVHMLSHVSPEIDRLQTLTKKQPYRILYHDAHL
ncbi:putative thioredoxin [Cyclospora cayetanensis]|uniref:Thioredoxin n=1 Tax=Cyclospora cayetanensis TaxID=88456 RepID=A0A1D3D2J2_9EIME|nr:putative thioredoxin [Cyclospora cayetanensis]